MWLKNYSITTKLAIGDPQCKLNVNQQKNFGCTCLEKNCFFNAFVCQ